MDNFPNMKSSLQTLTGIFAIHTNRQIENHNNNESRKLDKK